jgi:type I restriction enzyme S subunit
MSNIEKKKVLVPKLRFKGFDEDWKSKNIGSILTIGSGRDYKHLGSGNIPVFGTGGLMTMVDKFLYEGATVCIGRKGTIDKPMYFEGKLWTVDTLFYTHSFVESNPKYVFNLFQKIKWKEHNEASGVPSLSKTTIEKIKVAIPTLPEQQKIASFLSVVDEKIQQLTRKKELLEQYKKGLMQQLFSGKLRFKDENGKTFPKWEEKRLGDIGVTFNGLTGKTKENFGEGKPYIQYMQIFANSKIDITKCGFVQIGDNENQPCVQYGDVFFTTSSETPNEIGTCSVLLEIVEEMYLNSFCFGFRPNSLEQFIPNFASYLFRNGIFRKKIIKLAQGSTRYNMSKVQLLKLKVLLPSKIEQKKIANYLSNIDNKIESVTKQITQTQTFKKGLLQQMFV